MGDPPAPASPRKAALAVVGVRSRNLSTDATLAIDSRCQHHLDGVVQIATMRDSTFPIGIGPKYRLSKDI